jgi:hypothetical protein
MTSDLMGITSLLPKAIVFQLTGTGDDLIYTVPGASLLVIKSVSLCNSSNDLTVGDGSSTPVLVSVSVVPSGGTPDGSQRVISQYLLQPGDALSLTDYMSGMILAAGDTIYGRADLAPSQASAVQAVDIVVGGLLGS